MKNFAVITLNNPALETAKLVADDLLDIYPDSNISVYHKNQDYKGQNPDIKCKFFNNLDEILGKIWENSDAIIWLTATGITVRKIAPFLNSKTIDPAILVMNLQRTQIIPLLSGHIGGANEIAIKLSEKNSNLVPFITTATDTLNILALDTFAKNMGFKIVNIEKLALISNNLINKNKINLISHPKIKDLLEKNGLNPNSFNFYNCMETLDIKNTKLSTALISPFNHTSIMQNTPQCLQIRIKPISLGIGLKKNTPFEELKSDLFDFINRYELNLENIKSFSSFTAKKNEKALLELAKNLKKDLFFFDENEINHVNEEFSESQAQKFFKIKGVAEPSAILASTHKTLFIKKQKYKNITIAAAF